MSRITNTKENGFEKHIVDGKEKEVSYFMHNGKKFDLIKKTTLDFGAFGGGITSFYDFSLTKNVMSMILVCLFLKLTFFFASRLLRGGGAAGARLRFEGAGEGTLG